MRTRLIAFVPVLVAWAATPAAASAASIAVDRGCYADPRTRADTVLLTGEGFTPGAPYGLTLDGRPLAGGTGRADDSGRVGTSIPAPKLASGVRQHRYRIGVQEGANAPVTRFSVTRLLAAFSPSAGDPARLRARFSVFGFTLAGATAPTVYLHYVRPDNGRVQRTVRLGTTKGVCGSIARTMPRRLFPFTARRGTWRLQFDTSPRYLKGTGGSPFLFSTLVVRVRGR